MDSVLVVLGRVLLEGRGIFGGGACSCFGGVWHFWRVFWGCDILEEALAEFWRGVALQCYGGVWHFWRALVVFACSVLEVRDILDDILEEALPLFWRGVAFF